jgi:hypothetical protein
MPRKQLFSEMSLDHRQRENGASQPAVYVSKSFHGGGLLKSCPLPS